MFNPDNIKKALLITLLGLSINALAQIGSQTFRSNENVRSRMELKGMTAINIHSEKNFGEAINHKTLEQPSLIKLFDSIYWWQWNTFSIGWKMWLKDFNYVYDAHNNLTSLIDQEWNGSVWVNSYKTNCTYDARNNKTNELGQMWKDTVWVFDIQFVNTFDANNDQISHTQQVWNGSVWVNSSQYIYAYDAYHNLTGRLSQNWSGGVWVNFGQYIWVYDAYNNLMSELIQFWSGTTWQNSSQRTYTYDVHNNQTSDLYQQWNGSVWNNYREYTYSYDANNKKTSEIEQNWNGSIWVNYSLSSFFYDISNNLTSSIKQKWNGSIWVKSIDQLYSYDENNFTKGYSSKSWNSTGTEVTYGDSSYYYFHTNVGINELISQDESITVYPNPTRERFVIRSNSPICAIEIYNLFGERIYSDYKFNQQTPIDLSSQSKGIYFIKIHCGTNSFMRKIIVQ